MESLEAFALIDLRGFLGQKPCLSPDRGFIATLLSSRCAMDRTEIVITSSRQKLFKMAGRKKYNHLVCFLSVAPYHNTVELNYY
jgi:hypothetical protein